MARSVRYMQAEATSVAATEGLPQLSWQSQVAAAWGAAGAAAAGSLVAALLLLGRIHAVGIAPITLLLAAAGGMLGLIHGVVLGHLGRDASMQRTMRTRDHAFALLVVAVAFISAVLVALWVALSAVLLTSGHYWGAPALAAGGLVTLAVGVWATVLGWSSLERAYVSWADHRLGAGLVAGSFVAICGAFLVLRPAIPGTRLQLSTAGWLVVAALATIWVAMPAVVIALRIGRSGSR